MSEPIHPEHLLPDGIVPDGKVSRPRIPGSGRKTGTVNSLTRDLRSVIEQSFHKAGGRDYLVKVAHRRPDVFLALVGKIIPQETRLSVLGSYQALPIPVEARDDAPDMIAAPATSPAVLEAVWHEVGKADAIPAASDPVPADDWLAMPPGLT
jgi:hypothetical protein